MWILNGNGQSYLTAAEQERIGAAGKSVRFVSSTGHGLIADDGDNHLYAGERIVATWTDTPPAPVASLPVDHGGEYLAPVGSPAEPGMMLTQRDLDVIAHVCMHACDQAVRDILRRLGTQED